MLWIASGITPNDCFEILAKLDINYPDIPIELLLYTNLVYVNGIENFYKQCLDAGQV